MAVDLEPEFKSTRAGLESAERSFEDFLRGQKEQDRSRLAWLIIGVFVFLIAWLVIAVSVATYWWDWKSIEEPAKFLMAILSSVLLPVVTLVIGHYFSNK